MTILGFVFIAPAVNSDACQVEAIVFLIVFGVIYYFLDEIDGNWLKVFLNAMAVLCSSRGIKYIW